jgi:hypothetical protein
MKPKQPLVLVLVGLGVVMTVVGITLQIYASRSGDLARSFHGLIVTSMGMIPIAVAWILHFRHR